MIQLFSLWMFSTVIILAACSGIESVFGAQTSLSFLDAGFIAYVGLWCKDRTMEQTVRAEVIITNAIPDAVKEAMRK